jgi:hypothetical protein
MQEKSKKQEQKKWAQLMDPSNENFPSTQLKGDTLRV